MQLRVIFLSSQSLHSFAEYKTTVEVQFLPPFSSTTTTTNSFFNIRRPTHIHFLSQFSKSSSSTMVSTINCSTTKNTAFGKKSTLAKTSKALKAAKRVTFKPRGPKAAKKELQSSVDTATRKFFKPPMSTDECLRLKISPFQPRNVEEAYWRTFALRRDGDLSFFMEHALDIKNDSIGNVKPVGTWSKMTKPINVNNKKPISLVHAWLMGKTV